MVPRGSNRQVVMVLFEVRAPGACRREAVSSGHEGVCVVVLGTSGV